MTTALLVAVALLASLSGEDAPLLAMLGLALFSYSYLSLSNTPQKARQIRPAITTLFGLIHGFGFASVLLEVGLPQQAIIPALVGFNIGVETGQLAIVIALTLIASLVKKVLPKEQVWANQWLNALLCAVGSYWFVQRLFG